MYSRKDTHLPSLAGILLGMIPSSYTIPYVCLNLYNDKQKLEFASQLIAADSARVKGRVFSSLFNIHQVYSRTKQLITGSSNEKIYIEDTPYRTLMQKIVRAEESHTAIDLISLANSIGESADSFEGLCVNLSKEDAETSHQYSKMLSSSAVIRNEAWSYYRSEQKYNRAKETLKAVNILLSFFYGQLTQSMKEHYRNRFEVYRYLTERVESLVDYGSKMAMFHDRLPSDLAYNARNHPDWKFIHEAVTVFMDDRDRQDIFQLSNTEVSYSMFKDYADVECCLLSPILKSQEYTDLIVSLSAYVIEPTLAPLPSGYGYDKDDSDGSDE